MYNHKGIVYEQNNTSIISWCENSLHLQLQLESSMAKESTKQQRPPTKGLSLSAVLTRPYPVCLVQSNFALHFQD